MRKKKLWVIIAARSGSKGIKDKNIKKFLKIPLFIHSINFAKKLKFVDKILFSSDSKKYCDIAKKHGAYVPFYRSEKASSDFSMEEDILNDIKYKLKYENLEKPDYILWLRPTTPLRDLSAFNKAYKIFKGEKKSVCIVSKTEPRIFFQNKSSLKPALKIFKKKSMVRRQECPNAYKIFFGEFFKFPLKKNVKFLGNNIKFVVQDHRCDFDIDYDYQWKNYEKILEINKKIYAKFLHTN
jgi:CMP-N,N'-diacetyllegionaminic acid synthase